MKLFAVTFDRRPSSNEVSFYVGTQSSPVTLTGQQSVSLSNTSDAVTAPLTIGNGFDGLIDDVRLFTARHDITWINDDGTSYTNTSVENFSQALLSLTELKQLRAYDLRLPRGDFNEDRLVNALAVWRS